MGYGDHITSRGVNDQGNAYDNRANSSTGGQGYHYSNTNGSYYYANTDGSKYYNSGKGYAQYTGPSGGVKQYISSPGAKSGGQKK